ncbi:metalloregulator ArsR/SmtB family transcription factor [Gynuella sp.]|uniref:metalloregulator ArsR/SmtB family transcription factor n=1 Tax=Gynuella sp. TaxID=2969146 RepID=UPI003D0F8705
MMNASFEQLATLLKAAADPIRLITLKVLQDSSYGVLELSEICGMKQSGMSHHLKVLASAGWLETRKEGNSIFYRRSLLTGTHQALLAQTWLALEQLELPLEVRQRAEKVHQGRIEAAREFFNKHAHQFKKHQDLIAEFESYDATVRQLLQSAQYQHRRLAIEIGPGAGEFLSTLSRSFDQVLAIDISADMLSKAQQRCEQQRLDNVTLIQGEISGLDQNTPLADTIIYNMVLHHVPDPARELRLSAESLAPSGCLLITELCQHDQTWAKENCGDLWLGFEENELVHWARSSHLVHRQTIYVGLRNGFQIQCLLFQKPEAA